MPESEVVLDDKAPVVMADKPREPTAYEIELRREAQKHRLAKNETETKFADAQKAWEAEKAAIAESANAAANERVLRAELKAEAVKHGLADLEFLKLVDLKKIKLDENGEIKDADKFFEKLKTDKPAWFVDKTSTSSTATTPKSSDGDGVDVKTMKPEEYAAYKAKFLGR